jgi:hypothetical protein
MSALRTVLSSDSDLEGIDPDLNQLKQNSTDLLDLVDPDLNDGNSVKFPPISEGKAEEEALVIEQIEMYVRKREDLLTNGVTASRRPTPSGTQKNIQLPTAQKVSPIACCGTGNIVVPQCTQIWPPWMAKLFGMPSKTNTPPARNVETRKSLELQKKVAHVDKRIHELLGLMEEWLVTGNKKVVYQHAECLRLLKEYQSDVSKTTKWNTFGDFLAKHIKPGAFLPSVPIGRGVDDSDSDVDSILDDNN